MQEARLLATPTTHVKLLSPVSLPTLDKELFFWVVALLQTQGGVEGRSCRQQPPRSRGCPRPEHPQYPGGHGAEVLAVIEGAKKDEDYEEPGKQ